jgi:hypothetical protein
VTHAAHRAYADTPLSLWVRDDAGRLDMDGAEVEIALFHDSCEVRVLPATSPQAGQVLLTVTEDQARQLRGRNPYAMQLRVDGECVDVGLLEVV